MQYLEHIYAKQFIVHLKFKLNWAFYIWFGNPTGVSPKTEQGNSLYIISDSWTTGWLVQQDSQSLTSGKTGGEERICQSCLVPWHTGIICLERGALSRSTESRWPMVFYVMARDGLSREAWRHRWLRKSDIQQPLPFYSRAVLENHYNHKVSDFCHKNSPLSLPCKHVLNQCGVKVTGVVQWAPWKVITIH